MSKRIHRKRLFDGRATAEDVHQKYAFPHSARCVGCGAPPLTRAIVLMEVKEAIRRAPALEQVAMLSPSDFLTQTVMIRDGSGTERPYYRCSVTYACKACTPMMERMLAKAPSHCIVEINRGPGVDRVVSGPS